MYGFLLSSIEKISVDTIFANLSAFPLSAPKEFLFFLQRLKNASSLFLSLARSSSALTALPSNTISLITSNESITFISPAKFIMLQLYLAPPLLYSTPVSMQSSIKNVLIGSGSKSDRSFCERLILSVMSFTILRTSVI